MRKIKFYLIGLIPGILFVLFILNQKGASCSGYLPNSRVVAETLSKKFVFSETFEQELRKLNLNEQFLRDSIITAGEINFDQSKAQQKPCPYYLLTAPKKNPRFEITFTKCKTEAKFFTLRKLR